MDVGAGSAAAARLALIEIGGSDPERGKCRRHRITSWGQAESDRGAPTSGPPPALSDTGGQRPRTQARGSFRLLAPDAEIPDIPGRRRTRSVGAGAALTPVC